MTGSPIRGAPDAAARVAHRPHAAGVVLGAALCATIGVAPSAVGGVRQSADAASTRARARPGVSREYGVSVAVGNGRARTYVVIDHQADGRPLEVGITLDEAALEGLSAPPPTPAGTDPHAHAGSHEYLLPLPAQNPTPYKLVELDWHPAGHEPPGVYDVPHFDFHFYTISLDRRNTIDSAVVGAERFATMTAHPPPAAERTPFYAALAAPGTAPTAVPRMGVHWVDVRSPELQRMRGHPELAKPFTTTFIHGAWDGRFIFDEAMITRTFILGRKRAATAAQRDSVIPLPAAPRTRPAGYYPGAYRVRYDPDAREYHIALTRLTRRG